MVLNRIEIIFLIVLLCLVLLTYSREEHARVYWDHEIGKVA